MIKNFMYVVLGAGVTMAWAAGAVSEQESSAAEVSQNTDEVQEYSNAERSFNTTADASYGDLQNLTNGVECGVLLGGYDPSSKAAAEEITKSVDVAGDVPKTILGNTAVAMPALYAVATAASGTNWYVVTAGKTNFSNVAVSSDKPTFFVGSLGDAKSFVVTMRGETTCRVSIDPKTGDRAGVKLTVDRASYVRMTNGTEKIGAWTNLCTVSDLAVESATREFATNSVYRFSVAAAGTALANYNYKIGLGAEGVQYTFEPCGGEVKPGALSQSLTFNWTAGTPVGYLPPLTNSVAFGTNTWHYSSEVGKPDTNYVRKTDLVANVATTCYAHWSAGVVVPISFDYNLVNCGVPTNVVVTNYYGQGTKLSLYGSGRSKGVPAPEYENLGFLGWTTNAMSTAGCEIESFTASTNSPNAFYAQWTEKWQTSRTDGGLSIDGYLGTVGTDLEIPRRINTASGLTWPVDVVAIGSSAFEGCSAFRSLEIPTTVMTLGDAAFASCSSLTTVTYPTIVVENEYADDGFLDYEIDLGVGLFRDCTSLTSVQLPLGVNRLPDNIFSGCTALTEFSMPYTTIQVGEQAFESCTHLQTVEVTEGVADIYAEAFLKCARMKVVKFIGDKPEGEVSSDIFKGTQRNVLVAYLENMKASDNAYCGGNWPNLPGTWPEGDYSRTLTWIGDGKYPRCIVKFNYNTAASPAASEVKTELVHKGRVFGFVAPGEDDMGDGFSGWWTQPIGGRKIGNYREINEGMTVYAHWDGSGESGSGEIGSRSSEEYPVSWPGAEGSENTFEDFTGFYSADDDMFYYSASTFNGIVIDTDADNSAITGTVVFAFQDATYPADGGMQSAFTATITWNGGKTTSISGVADAEGYLRASGKRWSFGEGDDGTLITKSGIYGWLTDNNEGTTFRVYAARNRYAMSNNASKSVVLTGLQATKGTWHVVLKSSAGESEFSNGYSTFAITISGMGQAVIEGTLADGTKVSTSSTLIIGDGCCCLPVSIRPYGGKGGMSFMLWFAWQPDGSFSEEEDDVSVQGLTEWTAPTFTVPITDIEIYPLTFIDAKRYEGDASFECDCIAPVKITAYDKGTKWKIATGEENPDNLKVSYNATTGLFTGSFAVENSETGKKSTAKVSGAFTDSITSEGDVYHGYGTAVIKDEGSVPVEITTE